MSYFELTGKASLVLTMVGGSALLVGLALIRIYQQ